jgi:hypothetical protein
MVSETLRLDGDIRNWVLIPITVAMFLVGVLRHNFAKLLRSDAKAGTLYKLLSQLPHSA